MIRYVHPARAARLALLPCGHHAPQGAACAHRAHRRAPEPAPVVTGREVVRLQRGESVVLCRIG